MRAMRDVFTWAGAGAGRGVPEAGCVSLKHRAHHERLRRGFASAQATQ